MTKPNEKIQVVYSDSDTLSSYLNRGKFEFFMQLPLYDTYEEYYNKSV